MSRPRGLTGVAKRLRREMTQAERVVWRELRARRFTGFKFRRQEPIGSFVVDFMCCQARLIIELDGGQHAERNAADAERTHWLESRGFRVLRFWNNDVLTNTDGVMLRIAEAICPCPPHPGPLPPRGGRDASVDE
jgi:very-short-patch-repair endonuclease